MTTESEIKVSVLESASDSSVTVSAPEGGAISKKAVSAPDFTQSLQALVQPGNLRIVLSKPNLLSTGVSAHDVAAFILEKQGEMSAMKLQKLVYYSQAWSLVWDDEPLFAEEIQAWANGPVIPALYARHQGRFKVKEWQGDPNKLTDPQRETIMKVLEFYGPLTPQVLSDLTHTERPWLNARSGLAVGDRGSRVISLADMAEYYSSLA